MSAGLILLIALYLAFSSIIWILNEKYKVEMTIILTVIFIFIGVIGKVGGAL